MSFTIQRTQLAVLRMKEAGIWQSTHKPLGAHRQSQCYGHRRARVNPYAGPDTTARA